MSYKNHYPIPNQRTGIIIDEIVFPYGKVLTDNQEDFHYKRRLSREVQLLKSQYFLIENELIETFDYVYPANAHLGVFSPKYANIIKNACNLFETVARNTYRQIYDVEDINIYNYLALDILLDFKNITLESPRLESEFPISNSSVLKPFEEFDWNRNNTICEGNIPKWWTAYNNIKHNPSKFSNAANFENAIRAVTAAAIMMYKVYGAGVTLGRMHWYNIMPDGNKGYYSVETENSKLFSIDDGRTFYSFR